MSDSTAADVASTARTVPRQRGAASAPVAPATRLSWADVPAWAAPVLVAVGMALWNLTVPALWDDEFATRGAARLTWGGLGQLSQTVDMVLLPYYTFMKAVLGTFGPSDSALRLPSAAAFVGTTAVVVALGRRLGGRWTGTAAGLLFTAIPVTSRFAQEARPYAIAMLSAALAVLCLIRLIERPHPARAAAYAGALLLLAVSQPLGGALIITGHAVAVGMRRPGRATVMWAVAAVPGLVATVTLLVLGYRSRDQISWISQLTLETVQLAPDRVFLSGAVGGIVLLLAALAVRRDITRLGLAAAGFGPIVVLLILDQFTPIWVARYVLVAVPALAALAAAAVTRMGAGQTSAALAMSAVLGVPAQLEMRAPDGHGQDSAQVALIAGQWLPGDVVVFADDHPSTPWSARDIYDRYLPPNRPPDRLMVQPQRTNGRLLAVECPEASCLGRPARVWVVRVDNPGDPLSGMTVWKQQRLREDYRVQQRWVFTRLTVILLDIRPEVRDAPLGPPVPRT